jgi:hypothetical protein
LRLHLCLQAVVCGGVLFMPSSAQAQQSGRFADLKSRALELFQKGRYAEVAGKMEEIWEQDKSDPKVAEYLAMGYLYGEHDSVRAAPLMRQAIAEGGQATFLSAHSHDRLRGLEGDTMNEFCMGRISVSPGKLAFIADSGEHSTIIRTSDLKDFSVLGGAPGRIQIRSYGKTYLFRVKSQTRDEAILLAHLAEANLKP